MKLIASLLILFALGCGTITAHPVGNTTEVGATLHVSSGPYIELLQGRDGRDGLPGPPGAAGLDGTDGAAGLDGADGAAGLDGADGAAGLDGADGAAGLDGADGAAGLDGADGAAGLDGKNGAEGPPGERGEKGDPGLPGPRNGGVVYTRWGSDSCPSTTGTELLYSGRAGKTHYNQKGGGGNFQCMPDDPDYAAFRSGTQGHSYMYGVEYEANSGEPLSAVYQQNAPCAVCYSSNRLASVMIPAKTQCPSGWTLEYWGYLMAGHRYHYKSTFICVDNSPDVVHGESANTHPALLHHVEASCNGFDCPPYDPQKELTCVVCTK